MTTQRYQGEIVRWKDDKGFGFIKTPSIEKDIFLHISAIKNRQRQPKVGDTIYFDLKFEEQCKFKAINASFTKQINQPKQTIKSSTPSVQKKSDFSNKKVTNNFYHSESTKPSATIRQQQQNLQNQRVNKTSNSRQFIKSSDLRSVIIFIFLIVGGFTVLPALFSNKTQTPINPVPNTPVTPVNNPPSPVQPTPATPQNCNIKGNVSYNGEEKLYHKPGYPDYEGVELNKPGEQFFCSEQEAINAGFQDAAKYAN